MTDLINLLTSKEIIIVYIVAGVACFLYFIIYLIDKSYYKRKQKQNTRELNKLVEDINVELQKEEPSNLETVETIEPVTYIEPVLIEKPVTIEPVVPEKVDPVVIKIEQEPEKVVTVDEVKEVEKIEDVSQKANEINNIEDTKEEPAVVLETLEEPEQKEEITYTAIEPNKEEAQEELRRLTEELEKAEEETKNIDLTSYEEAQERDAIISLDELIKKSKEMYESNEITQYEDEGNEPISLADLEQKFKEANEVVNAIEPEETYEEPVLIENIEESVKEEQLVIDDFINVKVEEPKRPVYQENVKYKPSPIISPIYGIEKEPSKTDIELENTANYEKLDEEIKKTNEFLMTLRELQKHLD